MCGVVLKFLQQNNFLFRHTGVINSGAKKVIARPLLCAKLQLMRCIEIPCNNNDEKRCGVCFTGGSLTRFFSKNCKHFVDRIDKYRYGGVKLWVKICLTITDN